QIVATVKIIPYAVAGAVMAAIRASLATPALNLAPFKPLRTVILSTITPTLKASVIASTEEITKTRVEALHGSIARTERLAHDPAVIADAVRRAIKDGAEQVLISGASATADRED